MESRILDWRRVGHLPKRSTFNDKLNGDAKRVHMSAEYTP